MVCGRRARNVFGRLMPLPYDRSGVIQGASKRDERTITAVFNVKKEIRFEIALLERVPDRID